MGENMDPTLIFLGTAGDVYTMSKQLLSTGGFVIRIGEMTFHVDPGPSALHNLKKNGINVREITSLFVSSDISLRSGDVPALVDSMTYDGLDKKGLMIQNMKITFPKSVVSKLERVIYITPKEENGVTKVGLNDIDIFALPTFGMDEGIGFRFVLGNLTICYSGDTVYSDKLISAYEESDFLILNVPSVDDSQPGLNVEEAKKIVESVKPKLAIITGIGIKTLGGDLLNMIRDVQKSTGIQTILAKDGLKINLKEYL